MYQFEMSMDCLVIKCLCISSLCGLWTPTIGVVWFPLHIARQFSTSENTRLPVFRAFPWRRLKDRSKMKQEAVQKRCGCDGHPFTWFGEQNLEVLNNSWRTWRTYDVTPPSRNHGTCIHTPTSLPYQRRRTMNHNPTIRVSAIHSFFPDTNVDGPTALYNHNEANVYSQAPTLCNTKVLKQWRVFSIQRDFSSLAPFLCLLSVHISAGFSNTHLLHWKLRWNYATLLLQHQKQLSGVKIFSWVMDNVLS